MPRAGANYEPVEIIQSDRREDAVTRITVDKDGTVTVTGADDTKEEPA